MDTRFRHIPKELLNFFLINIALVLFQVLYVALRYESINELIPFYYTKQWGDDQLAPKINLFLIPMASALLVPFALMLYFNAKSYFLMYAEKLVLFATTFANVLLAFSIYRIVQVASSPLASAIDPKYSALLIPFFIAIVVTNTVTPWFIEYFKDKGIETNPEVHIHPAMLLRTPAVRGGGFIFTIILLFLGLVFVGSSNLLLGIYIGVAVLALLGLADDYQNTHSHTRLVILENPLVRLLILFVVVMIPVYMGIRIDYISSPLGGIFDFSQYTVAIGENVIGWASILFTVLWFVWVLNVLSWSNGVDGQFGGIVAIACIVIALLALRFEPLEPIHISTAKLAILASGISIGLTRFNWYPSKIMWGFGATAAGLVIATLSVLIGGKIAISVMIILVPFLDAVVTFIKRVLKKKNPFRGDQGHLHHLLHKRGWGVRRISLFYWATTALFGIISLFAAEQYFILISLAGTGIVAFFILFLNVYSKFLNRS